jgi:hypothetical protein
MNDTLAFSTSKMNHKQSNNTVFHKCIVEHNRIAVVFQLQLILFSIFGTQEWLNDIDAGKILGFPSEIKTGI